MERASMRGLGDEQPPVAVDLGRRWMVANHHQGQPPPPQPCPRCHSNDTKFCYFNNYNVAQPRYLCRGCKRHWTQGGVQRDIPIGGRPRKMRRQNPNPVKALPPPPPPPPPSLSVAPLGGAMLCPSLAQNGYFRYGNPLNNVGPAIGSGQTLVQSMDFSWTRKFLLSPNGGGGGDGASSSNAPVFNSSFGGSAVTGDSANGGWGSLLLSQNLDWLDFADFTPLV